ncbi:MAG: tRNA uridine-5-carboxymethylaminomethyl(34) synthesis GTPase MnmE [Bacteroidetes bacterium]|nr:MAG: tRNA uridine-5-carboxymethylaminomethyl(34) synthesis GTPase MnmE [Bacteroidota bacterium]
MHAHEDTIAAISTPPGQGALGMVRVSGPQAIEVVNRIFHPKDLSQVPGHSLHYGQIVQGEEVLDEVVVGVFRAPRSFTREDVVEISCHGSSYILQQCLQLLLEAGARPARPGEFSLRAYLHGALDLAQAEAVADLIASSSAAAHRLAMDQLRGGISRELSQLRSQLLDFTSLIELELDFSEEDVEFADRSQLLQLVSEIDRRLQGLIRSFQYGNALKEGVPTVIMGKPNAGKSTLLNALLQDERAIVSDIPGTTRDVIEDRIVIAGIEFRLQDTAGLRETADVIEAEGVSRTLALAQRASLLLYLFDLTTETPQAAYQYVRSLELPPQAQVLLLGNKLDQLSPPLPHAAQLQFEGIAGVHFLSAKTGQGLDALRQALVEAVQAFSGPGEAPPGQAIISNIRHLDALKKAHQALQDVQQGLQAGLTGDLLTIDIRTALHYIGEITGEITTDEVLGNIFGKFCIGK